MKSLFFVLIWSVTASVAAAQLNSSWLNPVSGDWADASNWSTDPQAPVGPNDSATLNVSGSPYTATIAADLSLDQINIDSSDATVLLQGGTLTAASGVHANQGQLLVESGTIANTRLDGVAGVRISHEDFVGRSLTLDDATLATELLSEPFLKDSYSSLFLRLDNSLIFDQGLIQLDGVSRLFTDGGLSLSGQGAIVSTGNNSWAFNDHGVRLTADIGISLRASQSGLIAFRVNGGQSFPNPAYARYTNLGVIEAIGGTISFPDDMIVQNTNGVISADDGGHVIVSRLSGDVGQVSIGENSVVSLGSDATLTQPISVPASSTFALTASDWDSLTTVDMLGGTLQVRAASTVTGTWNWGTDSALEVIGRFPYTHLLDFGVTSDTRIGFADGFFPGGIYKAGEISLSSEGVDLTTISDVWDFSQGFFVFGMLTGMPNGGVFANPMGSFTFDRVNVNTPITVTDGELVLDDSTLSQSFLVSGGRVLVENDWANTGGVVVEGGNLEFVEMPTVLGPVQLNTGRVQLPSFPADASSLEVTGGTVAFNDTPVLLDEVIVQPWTPVAYEILNGAELDLQGGMVELSASAWDLRADTSTIKNGTLIKSNTYGPLELNASVLRDLTIQADIASNGVTNFQGDVTVQGSRLTGNYNVPQFPTTNLVLDDVEVDGEMTLGLHYGTTPTIIVRNGLTVNGLMELNTRVLRFEGTQTIDGVGEMDTNGSRGTPGGGIEVVDGSLTLGPDFTFHSRRNGSKIIVNGLSFTNEGTLLVDVNEYRNGADVPEPGLTVDISGIVTSGGDFYQNGLIRVVDGYELRVEAYQIHNAGEIELRGGDFTASGVELINTGELRGHGLVVSTGDGLFQNQGTLAVGDVEPFGEEPASEIGVLQIVADFEQDEAGTLALDLAGPQPGVNADQLSILGTATLDGLLELTLIDGFTPSLDTPYELLTASGGINGTFDEVVLTSSGMVLTWSLDYGPTSLSVTFEAAAGDFDADGRFTGSDLLAWQRGDSPQPLSDSDLADWQSRYGSQPPGSGTLTAIPEPGTAALFLMAMLTLARRAMFIQR